MDFDGRRTCQERVRNICLPSPSNPACEPQRSHRTKRRWETVTTDLLSSSTGAACIALPVRLCPQALTLATSIFISVIQISALSLWLQRIYCFALHMASDYRTLRNRRIKTAPMCGRVDEIEWPLHIDQSSHQFFPEAISVFIYHVLISGTEEFYSLG